jgi:acyl-CoA dehydrogenase
MAGQGWRMLMQCLAAGRSISLPSSATGLSKLAVRTIGAYARVRTQFKTSIGRFEGIQELLARMGGNLYMVDAARTMTAGAVDLGEKPSVVSAIVKYHATERCRQNINDAMDIAGGKGICLGPSNFLGSGYMQMPVSITVEGANVLTRNLIIFGQGAIRCHPYVLREMNAAIDDDSGRGLREFDRAFWRHLGFTFSNWARSITMGLTGSHFVRVPREVAPETRRYYQQLTRFSAALAYLSDIAMFSIGGNLKRKERLSARLGDILSLLYLCSATLKRFEAQGRPAQDAPLMHWAIWDAMFKAQNAFEGVISNYPGGFLAAWLRVAIFPLGRPYVVPSDELGARVAELLIEPSDTRDRLTAGMYLPRDEDDPVGTLELALAATVASEPIEAKIRAAIKAGRLVVGAGQDPAPLARAAGVISAVEQAQLKRCNELRDKVIRVDDFPMDFDRGARTEEPRRRAAA